MWKRWSRVRLWLSNDFRNWNIEEYLPRITCPVLLIQGRDDEYGTLKQMDAIRAGVSGTIETLLLDTCGHSPHIDQRDAVEVASVRFLERLPG
ncbi:MAG: hypothetical protein C5B57_05045 [Blastocatellia bacterium]|nr:MAG: hypothetical protein C5B57_05045 [Blastocatellia bacterium]